MTAPWLNSSNLRTTKPRKDDPVTPEVRGLVQQRSKGLCELCGSAGQHLHHRQLRRSGDHTASNLVNLCNQCHTRVHGHVRWALDTGWIVSAYANAAETELLRLNDWTYLRADGSLSNSPPPVEACS